MVDEKQPIELDLGQAARDLAAGATFDRIEPWLTASCEQPERFYRDLALLASAGGNAAPKSRAFESYDFYHDLISRNLGQARNAIVYHEPGAGWRRLSYDELHARAGRLAAAWNGLGLTAGKSVAIIFPIGGEALVALAAALRLGLVFSLLPPRGGSFLRNRLAALQPDHIATHVRYSAFLGKFTELMLPAIAEGPGDTADVPKPHTYSSGEPAARLFSALSATPEVPVERTADAIYLPLLRDATMILALQPSDRVAVPGFDSVQFQPCVLFSTMFAGACFVELEEDALDDAELRKKLGLKVVGVTPRLRDRVISGQSSAEGWRSWFGNPSEPYEWERWDTFGRVVQEHGPRGFNYLASAAFGGCLLFSPRSSKPPHLSVLPAPGQPWRLNDLVGNGEPAAGDTGLYAAIGEDEDQATFGHFVLSRSRQGYFFSGSMDLGSRGQIYAAEEILDVVRSHPAVDEASVVVTVAPEILNKTVVTLMVFIDPRSEPSAVAATLNRELGARILSEMGARALPDRMKVYPLSPRRVEAKVDHDWCRWELASGALDKKSRDDMFRTISRLRRIAIRLGASVQ